MSLRGTRVRSGVPTAWKSAPTPGDANFEEARNSALKVMFFILP